MSASIELVCDAPAGEYGLCPARWGAAVATIAEARALAGRAGWWSHHDQDRCPFHNPSRRR